MKNKIIGACLCCMVGQSFGGSNLCNGVPIPPPSVFYFECMQWEDDTFGTMHANDGTYTTYYSCVEGEIVSGPFQISAPVIEPGGC